MSSIYKKQWVGHLSVFAAYVIFGLNIVVCKDLITGHYISPIGIFLLRSLGAGSIFWLLSLVCKPEKMELRDLPKIFVASAFGFFLTQLTFLIGIDMVTPMECSIVGSTTPIFTMFVAAVAIREPITWKKVCGVLLSFSGIIYLVTTGMSGGVAGLSGNIPGVSLIFANAFCFALYLGVFRPLIGKYSVVTFMKWVFLFAFLMACPFGAKDVISVDFAAIPSHCLWDLAFLIMLATFVAYFLIPFGQKIIRPTLVSMYSYVQPLLATMISIYVGMEHLTLAKVIAMVLVFVGVYVVSRSRSKSGR